MPGMAEISSPSGLLRLLKGGALSCLLALGQGRPALPEAGRRAERPLSEAQHIQSLACLTGYAPNTVRSALWTLQEHGLAEPGGPLGWRLTGRGEAALRLLGAGMAADGGRPAVEPEAAAEPAGSLPAGAAAGGRAAGQPAPPGQAVQNFCTSASLESDLDPDPDLDPDLEAGRAKFAPAAAGRAPPGGWPAVERILECSQELLGERVAGAAGRYPDAGRLLAWIAQAYAQRRRLHHPARLAYRRLEHGVQPGRPFRDDPCSGLPLEFLRRLGLPEAYCLEKGSGGGAGSWSGTGAGAPAGQAGREGGGEWADGGGLRIDTDDREPSPSLDLPAGTGTTLTARQAWECALSSLRLQASVGVYIQWLRPLVLLEFDPQAACFTAAHPDGALVALLNARLGERVLPDLLSAACGRPARVRFVEDEEAG